MANTSTGNNTTMNSVPTKTVKKVAKKDTVEAVAPVAAPVAAAPVKEVKAKKEKAVAVAAAAAPAVTATVSTSAPDASAVESSAPAVPSTTVQQDIDTLIAQTQAVRDSAVNSLKALQRLSKRVAREVKEAGRRRRRQRKTEGSDGSTEVSKRPTIFKTLVTLKSELCSFLGKSSGTQMTPADVTKAFSAYVEAHKLKNAEKGQGHTIHPDAAMRKLFSLKEDDTVSYRNVQAHLYKLYILPEKKSSIAAAAASTA
jgi:hypothetical protein